MTATTTTTNDDDKHNKMTAAAAGANPNELPCNAADADKLADSDSCRLYFPGAMGIDGHMQWLVIVLNRINRFMSITTKKAEV